MLQICLASVKDKGDKNVEMPPQGTGAGVRLVEGTLNY